ncbi:MAG: hypothetical protein ACXV8O_20180 [Methylobacter sp.]
MIEETAAVTKAAAANNTLKTTQLETQPPSFFCQAAITQFINYERERACRKEI